MSLVTRTTELGGRKMGNRAVAGRVGISHWVVTDTNLELINLTVSAVPVLYLLSIRWREQWTDCVLYGSATPGRAIYLICWTYPWTRTVTPGVLCVLYLCQYLQQHEEYYILRMMINWNLPVADVRQYLTTSKLLVTALTEEISFTGHDMGCHKKDRSRDNL